MNAKQYELRGQKALVTGSSRGIGKETALALARAGADVITHSFQTPKEAAEVSAEIRSSGVNSFNLNGDIADPKSVERMFQEIHSRWGTLDILVNNAGIVNNAAAEEMEYDVWSRMINVNLSGVFLCSQAAGKMMISQKKGGAIINVSSICGHIVVHPQKQCHYNAAKGGVTMLSKSLAIEWAPHGIRVNAISPGYIETELVAGMKSLHGGWKNKTPLNKLGSPKEIADVIVFLASPTASFVTGSDWVADGGYISI